MPQLRHEEARACHPDKNPLDDKANAKFQRLANAYQARAYSALSGVQRKWQTYRTGVGAIASI